MTKVFITGATGQVGSALVEYFLKDRSLGIKSPRDILCLVRNPAKAKDLIKAGVSIVRGDLGDHQIIHQALQDPEILYVFHNAANIDVTSDYKSFFRANVVGTRHVLDAFVKSAAKTLIFASSIAVYDTFLQNNSVFIIDENTPLGGFEGEYYSVTKRKAEAMIQEYTRRFPEKRFIITRLGPIIGKKDMQIVPNFIKLLSSRVAPRMISEGRDLFSIISPIDIARAQIFLAINPHVATGEAFNVCNFPITYREIYNIICDFYKFPRPTFSIPYIMFKLSKPLLRLAIQFFPQNDFFKKAFSESAMGYIGKTFIYKSKKIISLGFDYSISPQNAIQDALNYLNSIPEFNVKRMNPYVLEMAKAEVINTIVDVKESLEMFDPRKVRKIRNWKQRVWSFVKILFACFLLAWIIVFLVL
jgi:nucleoside-diphosphate-sugar epimerase